MISKNIGPAFMVSLLICGLANAQVVPQQTTSEDPESLRQMLANQPDYTAIQQFLFSEGFGGFGGKSKVARLGSRQVEVTEDTIFIHEPGRPTIKVFPKRKEYSELPVEENDDFSVSPEDMAKRSDVVFRFLAREAVSGVCVLKD